jgi:hypothetical protein
VNGSTVFEGLFGGIDRRAFLLALGTFAIGTDAFIIAGAFLKFLPAYPAAWARRD